MAQTRAATAAASSTLALPVSVARNSRSGACRLRAQAVRPSNADRTGESLILASFSRRHLPPLGRWVSLVRVAGPVSRVLSSSQLATLAEHGEERTAEVGEKLFEIGDESYPFIAIVEGEAAVARRCRRGDRPPRRLGLPRRDEPPLRADRLPDRRRDRADSLHRGRSRSPAAAALRGRLALRPAPLRLRRSGASCSSSARGSESRSSVRASRRETRRLLDFARQHAPSPLLGRSRGKR